MVSSARAFSGANSRSRLISVEAHIDRKVTNMPRFQRSEIISRLEATVQARRPIILASAGNGLVAKCLELGGADLIGVYPHSRFAMMGFGRASGMMPFCNANELTFEYGTREVLRTVLKTPVIFGACGTDPTVDMEKFLLQLADVGFSGVQNAPSVTLYEEGYFRDILDDSFLGFAKEVEMFRIAKRLGLFTIAYVYSKHEARELAEVGVDVITPYLGLTKGSMVGAKKGWRAATLDEAVNQTQEILEAAKAVNPKTIFFNHGGPIWTPGDVAYVIERSDTVGDIAGLCIENVAVEQAVKELTEKFKNVSLQRKNLTLMPSAA